MRSFPFFKHSEKFIEITAKLSILFEKSNFGTGNNIIERIKIYLSIEDQKVHSDRIIKVPCFVVFLQHESRNHRRYHI